MTDQHGPPIEAIYCKNCGSKLARSGVVGIQNLRCLFCNSSDLVPMFSMTFEGRPDCRHELFRDYLVDDDLVEVYCRKCGANVRFTIQQLGMFPQIDLMIRRLPQEYGGRRLPSSDPRLLTPHPRPGTLSLPGRGTPSANGPE